MKVCWCTLPSINPNACKHCDNNLIRFDDFTVKPFYPDYIPAVKKEIIEKFDEKGNLIERITRDVN